MNPDESRLGQVALEPAGPVPAEPTPHLVEVVQCDGHVAWSGPIQLRAR